MALKDALDSIPIRGRAAKCRICALIAELPEDEGAYLADAARKGSGVSLPRLAEGLKLEGHGRLADSIRHHRYVCGNA